LVCLDFFLILTINPTPRPIFRFGIAFGLVVGPPPRWNPATTINPRLATFALDNGGRSPFAGLARCIDTPVAATKDATQS
jgi:hypothetical protein